MTGGRSISFPFVNPAPRPWSCWGSSNADSAPAKLHLSQGPSSTSAVVYTPSGPGAATTSVKVANIRSLQVDRYSQVVVQLQGEGQHPLFIPGLQDPVLFCVTVQQHAAALQQQRQQQLRRQNKGSFQINQQQQQQQQQEGHLSEQEGQSGDSGSDDDDDDDDAAEAAEASEVEGVEMQQLDSDGTEDCEQQSSQRVPSPSHPPNLALPAPPGVLPAKAFSQEPLALPPVVAVLGAGTMVGALPSPPCRPISSSAAAMAPTSPQALGATQPHPLPPYTPPPGTSCSHSRPGERAGATRGARRWAAEGRRAALAKPPPPFLNPFLTLPVSDSDSCSNSVSGSSSNSTCTSGSVELAKAVAGGQPCTIPPASSPPDCETLLDVTPAKPQPSNMKAGEGQRARHAAKLALAPASTPAPLPGLIHAPGSAPATARRHKTPPASGLAMAQLSSVPLTSRTLAGLPPPQPSQQAALLAWVATAMQASLPTSVPAGPVARAAAAAAAAWGSSAAASPRTKVKGHTSSRARVRGRQANARPWLSDVTPEHAWTRSGHSGLWSNPLFDSKAVGSMGVKTTMAHTDLPSTPPSPPSAPLPMPLTAAATPSPSSPSAPAAPVSTPPAAAVTPSPSSPTLLPTSLSRPCSQEKPHPPSHPHPHPRSQAPPSSPLTLPPSIPSGVTSAKPRPEQGPKQLTHQRQAECGSDQAEGEGQQPPALPPPPRAVPAQVMSPPSTSHPMVQQQLGRLQQLGQQGQQLQQHQQQQGGPPSSIVCSSSSSGSRVSKVEDASKGAVVPEPKTRLSSPHGSLTGSASSSTCGSSLVSSRRDAPVKAGSGRQGSSHDGSQPHSRRGRPSHAASCTAGHLSAGSSGSSSSSGSTCLAPGICTDTAGPSPSSPTLRLTSAAAATVEVELVSHTPLGDCLGSRSDDRRSGCSLPKPRSSGESSGASSSGRGGSDGAQQEGRDGPSPRPTRRREGQVLLPGQSDREGGGRSASSSSSSSASSSSSSSSSGHFKAAACGLGPLPLAPCPQQPSLQSLGRGQGSGWSASDGAKLCLAPSHLPLLVGNGGSSSGSSRHHCNRTPGPDPDPEQLSLVSRSSGGSSSPSSHCLGSLDQGHSPEEAQLSGRDGPTLPMGRGRGGRISSISGSSGSSSHQHHSRSNASSAASFTSIYGAQGGRWPVRDLAHCLEAAAEGEVKAAAGRQGGQAVLAAPRASVQAQGSRLGQSSGLGGQRAGQGGRLGHRRGRWSPEQRAGGGRGRGQRADNQGQQGIAGQDVRGGQRQGQQEEVQGQGSVMAGLGPGSPAHGGGQHQVKAGRSRVGPRSAGLGPWLQSLLAWGTAPPARGLSR